MQYQISDKRYFHSETVSMIKDTLADPTSRRPLVQLDTQLRPVVIDVAKVLGFASLERKDLLMLVDSGSNERAMFSYMQHLHGQRSAAYRETFPDLLSVKYYPHVGDTEIAIWIKMSHAPDLDVSLYFGIDADPSSVLNRYVDVPNPEDLCLESRFYRELRKITIEPSLNNGPFVSLQTYNTIGVNFVPKEIGSALELFVSECRRIDSIVERIVSE